MFCSHCGFSIADDAKFCSSCGKSIAQNVQIEVNSNSKTIDDEIHSVKNLTLISDTINCGILGDDFEILNKIVSESMGVKNSLRVKFNLYGSSEFFIVLPVSKDKSSMALFGVLLGTGAIGAVAMGALSALSNKLEQKNANKILDEDNPFFNALIFRTEDLNIQVKETRLNSDDLFDIFKKQTHFQVNGKCVYKNKDYSASIRFSYEGQASNSSKERIHIYDLIFNVLGIPPSPIHTGKNPPF